MSSTPDQQHALLANLLRQAISGDEKARNQLLEALLPRLRDQVTQSLNLACRTAQSDILCSVVRRVIEQPALKPTLPEFLGWIGVIVRNRCHDEWRKRVKQPAPLGSDDQLKGPEEPPDEVASSKEDKERQAVLVWSAMQLLPEHYRQILEHTFYGGKSSDDIGVQMGLSAGNVRLLRHRALNRLRQLCGESR